MKSFKQVLSESTQLDEATALTTKSTNLRKQIELFLRDVSAEQKNCKNTQ